MRSTYTTFPIQETVSFHCRKPYTLILSSLRHHRDVEGWGFILKGKETKDTGNWVKIRQRKLQIPASYCPPGPAKWRISTDVAKPTQARQLSGQTGSTVLTRPPCKYNVCLQNQNGSWNKLCEETRELRVCLGWKLKAHTADTTAHKNRAEWLLPVLTNTRQLQFSKSHFPNRALIVFIPEGKMAKTVWKFL